METLERAQPARKMNLKSSMTQLGNSGDILTSRWLEEKMENHDWNIKMEDL